MSKPMEKPTKAYAIEALTTRGKSYMCGRLFSVYQIGAETFRVGWRYCDLYLTLAAAENALNGVRKSAAKNNLWAYQKPIPPARLQIVEVTIGGPVE